MKFISTRGNAKAIGASEAIMQGLATDGGLYIPDAFPSLQHIHFTSISSYPELAYEVLAPFFEDDPLLPYLAEICVHAFNFPAPLVQLDSTRFVLELFHGPTAAFKDFGARFLAYSMEQLLKLSPRKLTILVATSGDTGGAVAAAFAGREGITVKVLFPKGRVSERQQKQLTCWGGNIEAYEVDGSFDDCQAMVKAAFMDEAIAKEWGLSSANSINLGRLLPQMVYYIYASSQIEAATGKKPQIIIPSGNVGNSCGAYWAKMMGAPIGAINLALNANRTILDYLKTGTYEPRSSIATLANAMDVGSPSNMERLFALFGDIATMRLNVHAQSVSDETIKTTIKEIYEEDHYISCPHTATALRVQKDGGFDGPSIAISTAHPAKFETIVEPLINKSVAIPPALEELLEKESHYQSIGTDYRELFS